MLKNIDRQYSLIHIAGREYRVRYSLNALLCLEMMYKPLDEILKTDFRRWDIETVLQLVRAAMCSLKENRKAVDMRCFDAVEPSLSELGELIRAEDLPLLRIEIVAALTDSMPLPQENAEPSTKAMHEGHQRALYVDLMGRPEREFWDSTNKEIFDRIDCYLEVKGDKEAAEAIQEFDDD